MAFQPIYPPTVPQQNMQPIGGQMQQSPELAHALAMLRQAGQAQPDPSGGIAGGLADALTDANAKVKADQAKYAASPQGQIDPGAGPESLGNQFLGGLSKLGGWLGIGGS